MDQGAITLVLDLAKACERVSLRVVWAWATHFNFPRQFSLVLCGYFEHQRRVEFECCVAEPLQAITAILLKLKWSCLFLRIVLQDALSGIVTVYPTTSLEERDKELPGTAEKALRAMRMEVEEKGLTLSVTEGGKDGKSQVIASWGMRTTAISWNIPSKCGLHGELFFFLMKKERVIFREMVDFGHNVPLKAEESCAICELRLRGGLSGCYVIAWSTKGVVIVKDAVRSRSRPSRPSSLGRRGAAYFFAW